MRIHSQLKDHSLKAAMLVTGAFIAIPDAEAGSCVADTPNSFTCSGGANPATDAPINVGASGEDIQIITTPGFGMDLNPTPPPALAPPNVIQVHGQNVSFIDSNNAHIRSTQDGVELEGYGGSVVARSNGHIETGDRNGTLSLSVRTVNPTENDIPTTMDVDVERVTSGNSGIAVVHSGRGNATIRVGDVTAYRTALRVESASALTSINARNLSGKAGLTVRHMRSLGDFDVTVTGNIDSTQSDAPTNFLNEYTLQAELLGSVPDNYVGNAAQNFANFTTNNIYSDLNAVGIVHTGLHNINFTNTGLIRAITGIGIRDNEYSSGLEFGNGIANSITINANNISVEDYAIGMESLEINNTTINVTGTAVSTSASAIDLTELEQRGTVRITGNNVSGAIHAAKVLTTGIVDVTVNGAFHGGTSAFDITTTNDAARILNNGVIRNSNGLSASRAIVTTDSVTNIINAGTVTGSVALGQYADRFENNNVWNIAGGSNIFGAGNDLLLNGVNGRILAGNNGSAAQNTSFTGLETLTNNGLISMADSGAGDRLTTDGTATFAATASFAVDIDAAGASDRMTAAGPVTISDGAELTVNLVGALPASGTSYTILTGSSVTGQFDFDDVYYTAFLGLRDVYTSNSVLLNFTRLQDFADIGWTPNQIATGEGLDSITGPNSLIDRLLVLETEEEARAALDRLSGDLHPAIQTVISEDSRLPRNAILHHLSSDNGSDIWGQLFWNKGDSDGDTNAAALKRKTWGAIAGVDFGMGENAVIGVSGAYLRNDVDQITRASDARVETIHVLGYLGAQAGALRVKAGGGYAWGDVKTKRHVAFEGFSNTLVGDYKANLIQAFAEVGIKVPLGEGHVEPIAQIAYLETRVKSFTETGGAAALRAAREKEKSWVSTVGARFSSSPDAPFSVHGLAAWQRYHGSTNPTTRLSFAGGDNFTIIGAAQSRDAGIVQAEARFNLSPNASLGIGYDGVLGTRSQDHAAKATLTIGF